jgi:2-keto-4-pentenoate hydratase/2-oxohepta-3-ene-1,7-dioic acid hydratase in catechol pathway
MKIICIGRNYVEHAAELNNAVSEDPVVFLKPDTALITGRLPFFIPHFAAVIHHEVELVFRISRNGKCIEERFASRYLDAVTVGIDFTARDLQNDLKSKGLPWELAKAFDGSAAVGRFLPLANMDLNNLSFSLRVNGQLRQQGNSRSMIFSISKIIAFISQYFTLRTGDLIFTGTPAGVATVSKNDFLEGFIADECLLQLKVK